VRAAFAIEPTGPGLQYRHGTVGHGPGDHRHGGKRDGPQGGTPSRGGSKLSGYGENPGRLDISRACAEPGCEVDFAMEKALQDYSEKLGKEIIVAG